MVDSIVLKGVFFGHCGVSEDEKERRQQIEVDLELFSDFRDACKSDALDQAIDYRLVYKKIKDCIENNSFNLLEALAGQIAGEVLALGKGKIEKVVVGAKKLAHRRGLDSVEVKICRSIT
ncbi:MAG TPA: dihydroneopterin aldolase [Thermoplasmata archaeon]|nr:dihydroneopterin aldolase [Thermoplasmata archaeon]HIH98649.1 dihydroneopterin aldolase [Thermoplasmata archaeon]